MSKKMRKKKMRYDEVHGAMFKGKSEILYHGFMNSHIKGEKREVLILNIRGHHPCAYVKVPFSVADEIENILDCHGGVTYCGKCPVFEVEDEATTAIEGMIWIGWDYNHFSDYKPMNDILSTKSYYIGNHCYISIFDILKGQHKWTTEEIYAEVRYVVRQLNEWRLPTKRSNDEADCDIDYPIL